MLLRILALLAVALYLAACSDNKHETAESPTAESLTVTSYNMGLALNFVPYTNERQVVNEELVADYDSDVICFQEVWLQDQVDAVKQALSSDYTNIYTVPPEQVYSNSAACTSEEISGFETCLRAQCNGLSGNSLVECAQTQCLTASLPDLSAGCIDGVAAAVGLPGLTIDLFVQTVTQPSGKFAYEGSLGLILASKYTLQNRQFQDFIEDSSINHRGALYAEILLNDRYHVVGCAHPSANYSPVAYPPSGRHGSWEGENRFMQEQMIAYVNAKAGANPVFFGGDFNCSIANAGNSVDADFPANCQLWLDDGFADPAAEQLPCTFCNDENLLLETASGVGNYLLDHVFVKNLTTVGEVRAERVFDDEVAIEALIPPSELLPEDSPKMTHPSDHYGVELDIRLP